MQWKISTCKPRKRISMATLSPRSSGLEPLQIFCFSWWTSHLPDHESQELALKRWSSYFFHKYWHLLYPSDPFFKSTLLSDGVGALRPSTPDYTVLYLFHVQYTRYTDLMCYESCGWPWQKATALQIFPLHTLGKRRDNVFLGLDMEQEVNKHPMKWWHKDLGPYFK